MKAAVKVLNNEAVYLSNDCCDYITAIIYLQRALILCKHIQLSHPKMSFSSTTLEKIESSTLSESNDKILVKKTYNPARREIAPDEGLHSYTRTLAIPLESDESMGEESKLDAIISFQSIEGILCFNLGICYVLSDQDQEAELYFSRTQSLLLSQGSIHDSSDGIPLNCAYYDVQEESFQLDSLAVQHNIGLLSYRAERYEESLECFVSSLAKSIKKYGRDDVRVAIALNSIGVLLTHANESSSFSENEESYKYALEVLEESLSIRRRILIPQTSDKETGTVLNNIGRVKFLLGDYEGALEYHDYAYKVRAIALGEDHIDTGVAAFNIGKSYHSMRRPDDAFKYYSLYVKSTFHCANLKNLSQNIIRSFDYIATCFQEDGEYEYAAIFFELALVSSRSVLGGNDPYTAELLNRRGNMFFQFHELDNALESYRGGLAIEMHFYSSGHKNISITQSNISRVHDLKNLVNAERLEKIVASSIAMNIHALQKILQVGDNKSNGASTEMMSGKVRTKEVLQDFTKKLSDLFDSSNV